MNMVKTTTIRTGVLALVFGLIFLSIPCFTYGDSIARYGGDFMDSGSGARTLALGRANVSLTSGAWSLFWNPSGLMLARQPEVGLLHSERFDGVVDFDAAAVALPQPDGSVVGFGVVRLGVNGIALTDVEFPGSPISDVNRVVVRKVASSGDYAFYAAKSSTYRQWRWGIAPKLIFRHVGSELRGYGIGVDLGAGGRPLPSIPIEAGLSVRDVFSTLLAWEQTGHKEIIPSTVRFGLSSSIDLPLLEARLTPVVDGVYRFEFLGDSDAASLHAGIEYLVRDTFALRMGSDDNRLTYGGGISLRPVSIDYAFAGHDILGDTHRISVTIRWGRLQ